MKAAVLEALHEELKITEREKPVPGRGEVLVRLTAAAVNHRDLFIQQGKYAGIALPCILGSDGVGLVEDIGPNVGVGLIGQRVLINPSLDWGEHEAFQSRKFRVLGMPDDGTFAQYICIAADNVFQAPAHLSDEEAAALPLAGLTAYRALFRKGGFKRGERVFITGIGGGVALMALQFALAVDAQVCVSSASARKIEKAVSLGANGGVLYTNSEWHKKLLNNFGHFDLSIDGAGGDLFARLLEIAAPGGRIVNYGGTAGPVNQLSPQRLFWKQLVIKGSTMGNAEDFKNMLAFVSEHSIRPVIDSLFPLHDINQAFKRMREAQHFGKIVLRISEEGMRI